MSGDRVFLQLYREGVVPAVNPNAAHVAQCDDAGRLLVSATVVPAPPTPPAAPSTYAAPPDTTSGVAHVGAARVWQLRASNENSYGLWLVVVDQATAPGDDDAGLWPVFVPAGSSVAEVFPAPLGVAAGLAWAWSLKPTLLLLPTAPVFTGSSVAFAYYV